MRIALIVIAMMLVGCVLRYPVPIEEVGRPQIGWTKSETDSYFESRNGNIAKWEQAITEEFSTENGLAQAVRYSWQGGGQAVVKTWDIIFLEGISTSIKNGPPTGRPIKWSVSIGGNKRKKSTSEGMSMLCKDAISSGDRGRIFTQCN